MPDLQCMSRYTTTFRVGHYPETATSFRCTGEARFEVKDATVKPQVQATLRLCPGCWTRLKEMTGGRIEARFIGSSEEEILLELQQLVWPVGKDAEWDHVVFSKMINLLKKAGYGPGEYK